MDLRRGLQSRLRTNRREAHLPVVPALVRAGVRFGSRLLAAAGRVLAPNSDPSPQPIGVAVRQARELAIVALSEIGDAVLFSVFLRNVRAVAPRVRVTLVVRPEVAPLFAHSPHVDVLLSYDPTAPRTLRMLILPFRAYRFARRRLRDVQYDVAVVPRWDVDHHLATAIMLFSGARRRVGVSETVNERKRLLNAGFDSLLTDVFVDKSSVHEVEHYLRLLRFLGGGDLDGALELSISSEDRSVAQNSLIRGGLRPGERIVAFGIGAAHPKRRWPLTRFVELGVVLHDRLGVRVAVVGGSDDVASQSRIVDGLGSFAIPLAGVLTLPQTAAALGCCALFVGNDSAPVHLAAAVGVPCVEISCHPVSADPAHVNAPERFGPWGVRSVIVRPEAAEVGCSHACIADTAHCIRGVTTATVLEACEELLR